MPFDEYLYSKVSNYFKNKRKKSAEELRRTVFLDDLKEKLTIISRAVTGLPIEVFHAEREGGYKNSSFFFPTSCSIFETKTENNQFYIFRALYISVQKNLDVNWNEGEDFSLIAAQQKAQEYSAIILNHLYDEFPEIKSWHTSFVETLHRKTTGNEPPDFSWLYGKLMVNSGKIPQDNMLENFSDRTLPAMGNQPETTLKAKASEEIQSIEIDKKQQEDYVLTHNFEKVDTAEEFGGAWRDFDGDDDLEDHEQALDELNMKFTVRVDDPTHSVYQADFIENATISESKSGDEKGYCIQYDEWDFSKKNYKRNFCKVYPISQLQSDRDYYKHAVAAYATTLAGMRKMLTNINNKMQQQRRQPQGDEFDIDAVADLFVDVYSKRTPTENIYRENRKKNKDLSILLLLDISLSSDGYANGNRIIDVEKQVSILFGDILNEFNVDFSITGFYSKTRNYSTYMTLKDFDEAWDKAKHRIGAVQPDGYTRIGAALRHSGSLLDKRRTKNKWVILLSDGKPNDFDKYEGKYGIQDVKQALRELRQRQIYSYALAIEAQAKYYLPQMFGQNHYQILTAPTELLQALASLYEKIKHQS